jgi:hypothetical protein
MTTFTTEDRQATEFARTRQEQETQAILNMAKTIERMEQQLAEAKKRIIELEDLLTNK